MFENLNGMNTDKAYKTLARKGYYERMASISTQRHASIILQRFVAVEQLLL